jgi:hypothetical protein
MIIKFGHLDGDQNVVATFQQSRIFFQFKDQIGITN